MYHEVQLEKSTTLPILLHCILKYGSVIQQTRIASYWLKRKKAHLLTGEGNES